MPYVRKHARFTVLDSIPTDVWQEPALDTVTMRAPIVTDPECYLCIIGEEPADYYGNFTACAYTLAGYRAAHCGVSAQYLATCEPAPESTAREIIADYLRFWAAHEEQSRDPDDNAAELLRDEADRIESGKE